MDFNDLGEGRSRLKPRRYSGSRVGVTAIVIHHLNKDRRQGKTNRNRVARGHHLVA